jgi:membrane-associated protease RseP (regulator of RpoE activity)
MKSTVLEPADSTEAVPWWHSALGFGGLAALLVWLGVVNPWMLVFVVGIIVSVFLHEVGHFVTARRSGMKVTQFFIGFGPRLWSTRRGEVEYGVRLLPLGAFVRIIGMNNLDEVDPADEARTYRQQRFGRRLLVVSAGSLMHAILAVVLLVGVYATVGPLGETGKVTVTTVAASSPAEVAGLQQGDRIVSLDGVAVTSRRQLVDTIQQRRPGERLDVALDRRGERLVLEVGLGSNPHAGLEGVAYLGVASDSMGRERAGIPTAVGRGVHDLGLGVWDSIRGVVIVLNPVNVVRHVAGTADDITTRPTTLVGATQVSGSVGERDGIAGVITVLAAVNIFVGVINMAPLLPLDGGHASIVIYERLRSRRGRRYEADVSKMMPVATAVITLLGLLLLAGLYLDITQPLG